MPKYQPMLYELMTILPSHISDTEVDGTIDTIAKLVENAGGKVEKTQNLGKIKLAYPIKRQRHGVYAMLYVEASSENMKKLDQNLRLADEVVRHMLIARPEGIPSAAFKMVSYTPPLTSEGRRTNERDERAPKPFEKVAEKSVTPEEIAGKLDAILESDIMKNV
jgi:small subunit ribosomal protein S6